MGVLPTITTNGKEIDTASINMPKILEKIVEKVLGGEGEEL